MKRVLSLGDFKYNRYTDAEYEILSLIQKAIRIGIDYNRFKLDNTDYNDVPEYQNSDVTQYSLMIELTDDIAAVIADAKLSQEELVELVKKATNDGDLISLAGIIKKGKPLGGVDVRIQNPMFSNVSGNGTIAFDFAVKKPSKK